MAINSARLWNNIVGLSEYGKNETGGMSRLSFTAAERQAKQFVASRMQEAGLAVREDAIGNLYGRYEGSNPDLPVIMTGSHIDSVVNGGMFDGPAGVFAAIEALATMRESGFVPERSIEAAVFTDEEGARFNTGMLGSRAVAGMLASEELHRHRDIDGISIADAMRAMGYDPASIAEARRDGSGIRAYVELHIEQGKVLENASLPVGIVSGISAPEWLRVTVRGSADHAGTTPMALRQDSLAAVAAIMLDIEAIAKQTPGAVATVGQLRVEPGGVNIIPGLTSFSLDIRHADVGERNRLEERIRQRIADRCRERNVRFDVEVLHRLEPVTCSEAIVRLMQRTADKLGIPVSSLPSGAAHDAMIMGRITECGMIFIRSRNGVSHHPDEWSGQEDVAQGAELLLHVLMELSNS